MQSARNGTGLPESLASGVMHFNINHRKFGTLKASKNRNYQTRNKNFTP
jgi:hypothetical protein